MNSSTDTWKFVESYFKSSKYFLTNHHLDSYNDFIRRKIGNVVQVLNPFIMIKNRDDIVHEVNIYIGGASQKEIFINKPTIVEDNVAKPMYPNEARLKNLTYKSDIFANILVKYITKIKGKNDVYEEELFKNVKIGSIPIMLHSCLCPLNGQDDDVLKEMGECPYDQGGYFIIDGKEKVIVAQERIATNRLFINRSTDPKFSYHGLIRCTSEDNPLFPKTINIHVFADELPKRTTKKKEDQPDEENEEGEAQKQKREAEEEKDKKSRFPKVRNAIVFDIPNVNIKIPVCVLFRALGVESDLSILEHIVGDVHDPKNKYILDFLRYSIVHANSCSTQEEAFEYLMNFLEYKTPEKLRHVLLYDLFPNVGYTMKNKAMFLGYIVNKIVHVALGANTESDRDSYIYKRVDISGFLVGNLFRDYYNQFRNAVRNKLDNEYLYGPWRQSTVIKTLVNKMNISKIFRADIIENGMKKSLKGMWGQNMLEEQQDLDLIKQGIVQDLSRISYLGTISHLRRVNTPLDPTAKIVAPHRLHPSQWGIMCPCESPDGGSIGLLKNMAIMCSITFDANASLMAQCLKDIGVVMLEDVETTDLENSTKVLLNSNWYGVTKDPYVVFNLLKLLKRNAFINIFTSISWNILNNEISVLTEAGRCCRPLYVVDDDTIIADTYVDKVDSEIKWTRLIQGRLALENNADNIVDRYVNPFTHFKEEDANVIISKLRRTQAPIEYIDVEESNTALIAMYLDDVRNKGNKRYTYCEIHPSTIFSVVTHCIPLANHNQAPRNIFSGAQGKQAIGCYATNFRNRIDTMSYVLHYPQKCLVNTRYMEYINCNNLPHGENLIVAIAAFTGYNMEDSIVMNKTSAERGMFNLTYFKNIIDTEDENKVNNEEFRFMNPLSLANKGRLEKMKYGNYKKIDDYGIPFINQYISENDVIIGKCKVITKYVEDPTVDSLFGTKTKQLVYEDKSLVADKNISGIVDKVFVYNNVDGKKECKIRFRKIRLPELGDKCCSRSAQKGVVGMLIPQSEMPFTKDGIVPDIIINPHAIPTRMTISHVLECVLAKAGACLGTTVDGTPFNNHNFKDMYGELEHRFGLNKYGNEIMYNGMSGEQMPCEIFIGPTYYERLKHMVADKINYRSTGPITLMTRQPTQGKGNLGGLRIGNMETDSIIAHGMQDFLNESMMKRSDEYMFNLDKNSHFIAGNADKKDIIGVKAPYSMKQLLHEIIGLGVKPILLTEEDYEMEEIIEESAYNQDSEFHNINIDDADDIKFELENL
jgi:DNA-directed RNA polymerase II subunit RPB2